MVRKLTWHQGHIPTSRTFGRLLLDFYEGFGQLFKLLRSGAEPGGLSLKWSLFWNWFWQILCENFRRPGSYIHRWWPCCIDHICKGRYRSDHQKSVPDQSHLHPSHWKQEISEILPGEEELGKPGKLNLLDFKEQDSVNCCVLCDMDYTAQYVQHINTAIRYQVWPLSRLVSVNLSSRHRFADLA